MRLKRLVVAAVAAAALAVVPLATAGMMHPELGAHLSGMGETGVVNLTAHSKSHRLCWKFQLHTMHVLDATIRDKSGMKVANLGHMYRAKGCAMVPDEVPPGDRGEARPLLGLGRDEGPPRRPARQALRRHGAHVDGLAARHRAPAPGANPPRRYGRGLFLATVGRRRLLALLGQGRLGSRHRRRLPGRQRDRADPPERRLAHLHGRRLDAGLRSRDLAARASTGSSTQPVALSYDELRALPRVEQVSTFHCVTGWTVKQRPLGRRPASTTCSRRAQPQPQAHALQFVSAEKPYVDYLTLRAGVAPRRDARLRDGREAAAARARRAGAARDPGDVRLQERQVGASGSTSSPQARARLLGAARLRPRRVGRPLERLRLREAPATSERFSRTERAAPLGATRPRFFVLLATGLVLYLPRSRRRRRPAAADQGHPLLDAASPGSARSSLIVVLGDRRAARATARELDRFDRDDLRWLARRQPAPQGRFNAGQKLNAIAHRGLRDRSSSSPGCCSGSASATRASASRARCSSTTA